MRSALFAIVFLLINLPLNGQILDPVNWDWEAESSEVELGAEIDLYFHIEMETNWYVYAVGFSEDCGPNQARIDFLPHESYELIGEADPVDAKTKYDEIFECDVVIFEKKGTFRQRVKVIGPDPVIKGTYEYQTCNEVTGLCLPPKEGDFEFLGITVKGVETSQGDIFNSANSQSIIDQTEDSTELVKVTPAEFSNPTDTTLWAFMVLAFLSGLAALLTPCVFPMIPMTVTFFMKDQEKDSGSGIKTGLVFGISIIAIYTILGTVFALIFGADSLNAMATHWFPNIFAFLVFFIFSLSFLGMFEINLPTSLVNKMDQKSDRGGILGIFFMAFTLALVSFSCTFPIVGLVLALSAQGAFLKPVVGMLSFSLALALPFTLFAIFPHWLKKLPKSGGWLNSVKVVLGFLELALGLKFLSVADLAYHWGILDREIYIAAWIVIFTLMGFYILGKLRLPHDSPLERIGVPRVILSVVIFSFVVYLVPGMFGAPLKGLSGYLPPMHTMDKFMSSSEENEGYLSEQCAPPKYADLLHFPHGINGYFDLEQAISCAQSVNKPIFIDFTGHGCVNCRKMEEYVWSDPAVLQLLKTEFVMTALYVDDKTELPEEDWYTSEVDGRIKKTIGKQNADFQISRFNNNAQPFYIILTPDGDFLHGPKDYDTDIGDFVNFLNEGLDKFKER